MTSCIFDLSSLDTALPQMHSDNAAKSRARRTRPERVCSALAAENMFSESPGGRADEATRLVGQLGPATASIIEPFMGGLTLG